MSIHQLDLTLKRKYPMLNRKIETIILKLNTERSTVHTQEKSFTDFQQTTKVFPTNSINFYPM